MLMIRFQRIGRTNDPAFRIVVLEKERAAKAGSIVELLGTYNPRSKALTLNEEQVKYWISKGAQPTGSIHNLLINKGIITGKKVNVLQKHTPQKNEVAIAAEAAAVAAAAAAKAAEAVVPEVAPVAAPTQEVGAPTESVGEEVVEAPTEAEVAAEAEPAIEEVVPAEVPAEAPTETPAA